MNDKILYYTHSLLSDTHCAGGEFPNLGILGIFDRKGAHWVRFTHEGKVHTKKCVRISNQLRISFDGFQFPVAFTNEA